ncbi:hypothetical protein BHE74_00010006 [Ensete ventricosum]|nr:hypothetical protein BHE74_00010006 [Ensete ventricosum]
MCVSSSVSVGERLGSSGEVGWVCSGTCLGWVCSRACLELLLLGVCRGILHEGLIEVGMPDVAPPTIKSVPRSRLNLNTVCRVPFLMQNHHYMMALIDHVYGARRLITIVDHWVVGFLKEIEDLKFGAGPEAIATAERQAAELLAMNEKLKANLDTPLIKS